MPRRDPAPPAAPVRAFTLVELLIVVLIIGIVAGIAVPMLGQTDSTRLTAAAQLLAADLAFAQNESITHGDDPRLVVFDAAANTYHIAPTSTPDTPVTEPVTGQPFAVTFGQGRAAQLAGVTLSTLSMDGDSGSTNDRFAFGIYGQIDQATDATITLASGGMTILVTVNATTGETTIGSLQ